MNRCDDTPIKLFVGSSPTHAVQEVMFIRSVLQHASAPVEFNIIDASNDQLRRINPDGTKESIPLPKGWKGRIDQGGTGFTYARFAAPELCGFKGRAIYCEADQLLLADIAELWRQPLLDASCAAVPERAMRGLRHESQTGGHLSSVVLFDSSRCTGLKALDIYSAILDGAIDFSSAFSMTEPYLRRTGLSVTPLPAKWNDHEQQFPDTALLHFSTGPTRPGRRGKHPANRLWITEYLACIDEGLLDEPSLDTAVELGELSARVRTLARVPRMVVVPIDELWQRAEPFLPHLAKTVNSSRRTVRLAARKVRRPLNRKRRKLQASLSETIRGRTKEPPTETGSDGSHN